MRILCCCAGGSCRSVTLATLLKYYWSQDALACSLEKNKPETLDMLFDWANHIVVVDEEFFDDVPEEYHPKMSLVKIGKDMWGMSMHPDLILKAVPLLEEFMRSAPRKTAQEIIARGSKYTRRGETVGE